MPAICECWLHRITVQPIDTPVFEASSLATSAVSFLNNNVFVRDSDLGDWIHVMTSQSRELIHRGEDIEWLLIAFRKWCDIYENFPPGLKDIELDDTLKHGERKQMFERLLESTSKCKAAEGYSVGTATQVSSKILSGLFSASH